MDFFSERLQTRQQQQTFSAGRKIRSGTKAISKATIEAAANNAAVGAILRKVNESKISFREAEKELAKHGLKNPFYPRNTREFHAHPWDMGVGSAAITARLLELYGEKLEGDTHPKLYKFPIVFPEVGGDVATLVQGGFSVDGGGPETVRYWSAYDDSGARVCKHLPQVTPHAQAQRKKMRVPERTPVTRGLCDPAACFEYQNGMCKFNGTVNFYIPGIPGSGVFQLHTGATQAATEIYLRVTEAIRATNGRLPNFTPDGRPLFWLTKEKKVRKYFDNEGRQQTSEQWVPAIDMEIELPKVLWLRETGQLAELAPPSEEPKANRVAIPSSWEQPQEDRPATATATAPAAAMQSEQPLAEQPSTRQNAPAQQNATGEPGDADAMLKHAEENGYREMLEAWVKTRYQGDSAQAATAWSQLLPRFGIKIKDYMSLILRLNELGINAELALKYFKIKFGPLGTGAHLMKIKEHLEEVAQDGTSVAITIMEEALESASQ